MFGMNMNLLSLAGLFITVIIGFPAMFTWGQNVTESKYASRCKNTEIECLQEKDALKKDHEKAFTHLKASCEEEKKIASREITTLHGDLAECNKYLAKCNEKLEKCVQKLEDCVCGGGAGKQEAMKDIFVAGHFADGLDMNLNTSTGATNWARRLEDSIEIAYPGGADWGTWFISVGAPVLQKTKRSFIDASKYSKLRLELKGKAGSKVAVALKDVDDTDDGTESRVYLSLKSNNWESYEIALKDFKTANLQRLYVVTSFVFAKQPQTFFVRTIQFQ